MILFETPIERCTILDFQVLLRAAFCVERSCMRENILPKCEAPFECNLGVYALLFVWKEELYAILPKCWKPVCSAVMCCVWLDNTLPGTGSQLCRLAPAPVQTLLSAHTQTLSYKVHLVVCCW